MTDKMNWVTNLRLKIWDIGDPKVQGDMYGGVKNNKIEIKGIFKSVFDL